jgi:ankyrin repeat protein
MASHIRNGIESLFDWEQPYFSVWIKLHNIGDAGRNPHLDSKIQQEAAPLYYAAFHGIHNVVECLSLKYPQYVNAISSHRGMALHPASEKGHVEVVLLLLKCGTDVDAGGILNQSPLQVAVIHNHLHVVQRLLEHGADANCQDVNWTTTLSHAAMMGHVEIAQALLEHDADLNFRDELSYTWILEACLHDYRNCDSLLRLLLEHGADPNCRGSRCRTPLHHTSSRWNNKFHPKTSPLRLELVRILLVHGANIDAEDKEGRTPLQAALASRRTEIAELLSGYCSQ